MSPPRESPSNQSSRLDSATALAVLANEVLHLQRDREEDWKTITENREADQKTLATALAELRKDLVTKDAFKPVMLIAFGIAAITLSTVLGGILALLIKHSA